MAQQKPLNIGIVGYGFMGRTHSNAYKRVNDFFDLAYRPVLKAVCGRDADERQGVRRQVGLRVGRDRLAEAGRAQGHRRDRHLHARTTRTPRSPSPRPQAGKMILCEKPLAMNLVEGQKMVDAVEKAGVPNTVWYNYRRVPGRHAGQAADRRGPAGPDLPLPRQLPPGLDDLRRPAAGRHGPLAARRGRGRLGRHRRPAGPLHRHGPLAQRPHQHRLAP